MGIVASKETNNISKPICEYYKGHKKSQEIFKNLYVSIAI
jgi:hypothetical protein